MLAQVLAVIMCLSVRPSVCLAVTQRSQYIDNTIEPSHLPGINSLFIMLKYLNVGSCQQREHCYYKPSWDLVGNAPSPLKLHSKWPNHVKCPCGQVVNALGRHVQYSVTRSMAEVRLSQGASAHQRIISNNSYAHDEQGVNPGQVRGFDGVLCKLWPLLMPWLAASRYQPRWRESQSRYMWLSLLADAAQVSIRWPGAQQQTGGLAWNKCQSRPGAGWWSGQDCCWTSASRGLVRQ